MIDDDKTTSQPCDLSKLRQNLKFSGLFAVRSKSTESLLGLRAGYNIEVDLQGCTSSYANRKVQTVEKEESEQKAQRDEKRLHWQSALHDRSQNSQQIHSTCMGKEYSFFVLP